MDLVLQRDLRLFFHCCSSCYSAFESSASAHQIVNATVRVNHQDAAHSSILHKPRRNAYPSRWSCIRCSYWLTRIIFPGYGGSDTSLKSSYSANSLVAVTGATLKRATLHRKHKTSAPLIRLRRTSANGGQVRWELSGRSKCQNALMLRSMSVVRAPLAGWLAGYVLHTVCSCTGIRTGVQLY